jgi:hypothetical protein
MKLRRARRTPPSSDAAVPVVLCRWDLDKTYLRSEFDSIRQLVRTALERGEDKVNVPGVVEVIKSLRDAATAYHRTVLIHFLSASPPQIGKAIRDKLALDGVPYDGIVFKDQLRHLRRGKLRNLREHVGFKLAELLRGRLDAPLEARELLFGDDWESDSLIYSLYADTLAGRLGRDGLVPILRRIRVDPVQIEEVTSLAVRAAGRDLVERIFINLERRSPPGVFRLFGPRVVPTSNYFQTAAVLAADGHLDAEHVARVGRALMADSGYTARRLENSLEDLVRRGHLTSPAAVALEKPLRASGILPPPSGGSRWRRLVETLGTLRRGRRVEAATTETRGDGPLDYGAILDRLRPQDEAASSVRAGRSS